MQKHDPLLAIYEHEIETEFGPGEQLFRIIVLFSFLAFGGFGWYLRTHNPSGHMLDESSYRPRQVSFVVEEKKATVALVKPKPKIEEPKPVKKPEPAPQEPIDLTKKPVLAQKIDDVKPQPDADKTPVRRVYGLRKVYATGLGEGGAASDAVIGKIGNTLATDIDTLKASKRELKGTIVPITTVTEQPKTLNTPAPEYTHELEVAHVDGVLFVKILIGADGKVADMIFQNDLGYGTQELARKAILKWTFEPARIGNKPVAVWIAAKVRFTLLPG